MREKRATSAEGKTIRIAESSDMDNWEAVLGHVQSFEKFCKFLAKFWKSLSNETNVEVMLSNYTKWSSMSCGR